MKSTFAPRVGCVLSLALLLPCSALADGERLLAQGKTFHLWLSYPPEKFDKSQQLSTDLRADRIALSAAKGEFEPFVLALRPQDWKPLMDVRFDFEPLRPAKGHGPALSIEYQRMGYVHVVEHSGMSIIPGARDRFKHSSAPFGGLMRAGYYPDRLVPDPIAVADPGVNTQFWFTVSVPRDAAAGPHRGTMRLRMRGLEPVRVPIEVDVFDFALPASSTLRNTTCWSPQYFGKKWNTPEAKAMLKALYRDMAEHRQTPDPILPQPNFNISPDGTVTIDSKDYEEMLGFCMDELGLKHFFFPRVGGAWYTNCYWLWHNPMVRKERWYGVQILDEQLRPTAKFQAAFGSYVKQMMARFEARGWADRVYMTTMDEPHKPADMKVVRNVAAFVHSVAPRVRRFCTTYPRPELFGAVDAWCPQQYDEALVKQRQAKGEQLMFYKNWLHLIDMPMVNPRLQGWIAWEVGAVGWLTYATMGRWRRAWDEPYATYANTGIRVWGLGLWWYPDLLRPRILKSVRWEMMREGAEDYEYLALLAKRLESLPDAQRQTPAAKAAQAFLDTAADKVVLYPGVFPCGRDDGWKDKPNYTQSNRVPWELRNEAARLIAALARKP